MKQLITLISALFFLVIGVSHVWALPKCVGSWSVTNWDNCFGTYTWASGSKYIGEYKDGKRHGQGAHTQANGNKYVGEYKDGKRHGQGTYNWKDGRIWVGEWENGELSGYAITYDASGSINQEGIFKDGKFLRSLPKCVGSYSVTTWTNCFGTYIYTNGDYVGAWKNGKRNGQGTYTYASGGINT